MKTLPIEEIISALEQLAGINIDPAFLEKEQIDAPILKTVDLLLDAVGEKGLKLTPKGNLPTKVVKELAFCAPTLSDQRLLKHTRRFLEEEQVAAQRIRAVTKVGKLLKVSKGKLMPGTMVKTYQNATEAEKFLYLFHKFALEVNLAYFDLLQEAPVVGGVSLIMLQVIRDKERMFREPEVYSAFLLDAFPRLEEVIEAEVAPDSYFSEDPFDEFERIVKIRLFQNFFAPFGLVEEQGVGFQEQYTCTKTALLDALLLPQDAIDTAAVLNRKQLQLFENRIRTEKLDAELFEDLSFIFVQDATYPLIPASQTAKQIVGNKRLLGTAADKHDAFYRDLANSVEQTLRYFTQLEVKGGGSRGDAMKRDFRSLIEGLYALLPKNKPYTMLQSLQAIPVYMLDMLSNRYGIDIASASFYEQCVKRFSEETAEDIGAVIMTSGAFEKNAKKAKRINAKIETIAKEAITAFVLGVMSIYTFEMDHDA